MSLQQINLYHPIFRREKKLFSAETMLQIVAVLVVAILLVYAFDLWQTRSLIDALSNVERVQQESASRLVDAPHILRVRRLRAHIAALRTRKQILIALQTLLTTSRETRGGDAPLLVHVGRSVVPGLWITEFTFDRTKNRLVLVGKSENPSLVPIFLDRVVRCPLLKGFAFQHLVVARPVQHGVYKGYVTFRATTADRASVGGAHGS